MSQIFTGFMKVTKQNDSFQETNVVVLALHEKGIVHFFQKKWRRGGK